MVDIKALRKKMIDAGLRGTNAEISRIIGTTQNNISQKFKSKKPSFTTAQVLSLKRKLNLTNEEVGEIFTSEEGES